MRYLLIILMLLATPLRADILEDILYPTVAIESAVGSGSGTAVAGDSILGTYIITNYHVAAMSKDLKVLFHGDDKEYPARLIHYNIAYDMAVLITEGRTKYYTNLGKSSDVTLFKDVLCIGNSFGNGTLPSKGIISQVDAEVPGFVNLFYKTDCKMVPGNSGGGMYTRNKEGWVYIGMPSKGLVVGGQFFEHLGLAVRVKEIKAFLAYHHIIPITEAYDLGRPY
jgi:S1-C subfamily serine protease